MDSVISEEDIKAIEAIREKYREEKDRRIRPEGNDQYVEVVGDYAEITDDPNVDTVTPRDAIEEEVEVLVVGGGFSGLLAGVRLREAGIDDFRIIDAGSDFGGTWYWNRYPGSQCDVESYCYLPLLEELKTLPKDKYSYAPDIFEHCQRIGKEYDLYKAACFQTKVYELRWEPNENRWIVKTNRGDVFRARYVLIGVGPLGPPKLPAIPGMGSFEGHVFHTSRWDYDYTGGSHSGDLNKLSDKRVAIIGTGCTAIQSVPHLAESAEHLFVFQRTPSSVAERGNKPTDPDWAASLLPGWQQKRRKNFNDVVTGKPVREDMVHDGWGDTFRMLAGMLPKDPRSMTPKQFGQLAELADLRRMNELRDRVDETIDDPAVADALKAWYRRFCKRPTFSDTYLPTFNRPNVTLVDTSETQGVEAITPTGLVANGTQYDVDCIVFSTGFEVGTLLTRRSGFELYGEDGQTLSDYWTEGGLKTFHGFHVHGFPNCFIIGPSQKGLSVNYTSMIDDQARHIAYIIGQVKSRGGSYVGATKDAETEWVSTIRKLAINTVGFLDNCTPGYYNNEGQIAEKGGGWTDDTYGPGANAFNRLMADWREDDELAGLDIR